MDDTDHDAIVHLLWTGGWDSTFRLLQLLLVHRVQVVPHYLIDDTRASTPVELQVMARIGEAVCTAHPHARALLHPLRVTPVASIHDEPDLRAALQEIRARDYIGSQYAWLPAYCKQRGIPDMELGVHVDDKVQALLRDYAIPFAHPAGFDSMRVDPRHAGTAEHRLFRWFSFPLFGIDKPGIEREARERGWSDVMDMTWFCHAPVRGRACGLCAPCTYTIEEGLAHRVPWTRRVLSWFWRRLLLPIKHGVRRRRVAQR